MKATERRWKKCCKLWKSQPQCHQSSLYSISMSCTPFTAFDVIVSVPCENLKGENILILIKAFRCKVPDLLKPFTCHITLFHQWAHPYFALFPLSFNIDSINFDGSDILEHPPTFLPNEWRRVENYYSVKWWLWRSNQRKIKRHTCFHFTSDDSNWNARAYVIFHQRWGNFFQPDKNVKSAEHIFQKQKFHWLLIATKMSAKCLNNLSIGFVFAINIVIKTRIVGCPEIPLKWIFFSYTQGVNRGKNWDWNIIFIDLKMLNIKNDRKSSNFT